MKAFWAVVGLLMVGAAVYVMAATRGGERAGDSSRGAVEPIPEKWPGQNFVPESSEAQAENARNLISRNRARLDERIKAYEQQEPSSPAVPPAPAPETTKQAENGNDGAAAPPKRVEPGAGTPRLTEDKGTPPKLPDAKPADTQTRPTDAKPPEAKPSEGAKAADPLAPKIVTKDDGSLLVDDKFIVRGKGSAAEPYKVTWDQLLSAQDDYVPKEGRKKIPGRISMLDGKWVEVTGYIAFPIMAESQDEALAMMNQWDGCCIGVPPTPYDAIEVRLKTPATGNARMTTYGTMKGQFKVDPHLVGGWLVGLYVMDNASMNSQGYGGFAP